MDKKIKILHLEDSVHDSELIRSVIENGKIEHDYFFADSEKDFISILENKNINIILSDYSLPGYNGSEALKIAREGYAYIPFIFVSGTIGEDAAINAMLNGATDYVFKNKLERLIPAIKRALDTHELELRHRQAESALRESERKYKSFVNEVNDGYFVTNNQGVITFANTSMAKVLGFTSPEELLGHFFTEFNKTNNLQEINDAFKNIIENKKKLDGLEMEVLRVDGNSIYIEVNAVPVMENGNIAGMQGVIRDITERKKIELKLKERNELIQAQNEEKEKRAAELVIANIKKEEEEKYRFIIEEKNRNITDSIDYAKRIQLAKLPLKEKIYASFPQSFILFKPKDIISGDFYFYYKNHQSVFIAAADCTGHGVPGALMSMIGSDKLFEAVSQSTDTSNILKYLNTQIKKSLHQSDSYESTRDGMDIALCSVDILNRTIKYAGANIPFWLIRKGSLEVEEIKGTRTSIGGLTEYTQEFDSHELQLQHGDTFYLSSDGYADQFGGPDKRKLLKKYMKKILLDIQYQSMQEQEKHLDNFIANWKAGSDQIDDILVIGVRM